MEKEERMIEIGVSRIFLFAPDLSLSSQVVKSRQPVIFQRSHQASEEYQVVVTVKI